MTNEKSRHKVFTDIFIPGLFIWELLRVTAWLRQKLQSSGECSQVSASTLPYLALWRSCREQGPWLALEGWLLMLHHQCPPEFLRSCIRKSCKTLICATEVIKHSPSSSYCNVMREPCCKTWFFFLSSLSRLTHTVSTGLYGCQVLQTAVLAKTWRMQSWKAAQVAGCSQPEWLLTALRFPAVARAHDFSHSPQQAEISFFSIWQSPLLHFIPTYLHPLCRLNNSNSLDNVMKWFTS